MSQWSDVPDGWEVILPSSSSPPSPPRKPRLTSWDDVGPFDYSGAVDLGSRWGTVTNTSRDPQHNARVGGVENSFHLTTRPGGPRALDIARRPGVRHRDIEEAYRSAGYELIESLDEGDHSHLAFLRGPEPAEPAPSPSAPQFSDVPDGWEVVLPEEAAEPQADPPEPFGDQFRRRFNADRVRLPANTPLTEADALAGRTQAPIAPRPQTTDGSGYKVVVQPSKVSALQQAFDSGASVADLVRIAGELNVSLPDMAELRNAVAFRDDDNPATIGQFINPPAGVLAPLPEDNEAANRELLRRQFGDQQATAVYPWEKTLAGRVGEAATQFADLIGHPNATRVGREIETGARWTPIIGGADAIEEGVKDISEGNVVSGVASAALGSLDFIPAVGPVGRFVGRGGKTIIDGESLKAVASGADGAIDAARAGDELRRAADEALQQGGRVTLHIEGKAIPITQPGLVDEQGQAWGALPILSPKKGDNARVEIELPEAPPGSMAAEAMAARAGRPADAPGELPAPRQRDYLNVEPAPKGIGPEWPVIRDQGRVGQTITPEEFAASVRSIRPDDLRPIPRNVVDSLEEAQGIGSPRQLLEPPNPVDELSPKTIKGRTRRQPPLDLVKWVRAQEWALADDGGELSFMGITNAPRASARGEGFLGRLVDNKQGVSLDEAALRAWEAGFFPEHSARPSVNEFLEKLGDTYSGRAPAYRPDDLDELERYSAAQADRDAIESAAQEGRPIVEDRGQPIGPEDLKANEPPEIAYEDLPAIVDRVGNINLKNIRNAADINRAMARLEREFRFGSKHRRTHAQVEAAARESGMTADEFLAGHGEKLPLDSRLLAGRALMAKAYQEMLDLIPAAKAGGDAEKLEFQRATAVVAAIHNRVSNNQREVARALSAARISADPKMIPGRVLSEVIEQHGGAGRIEDLADAILELEKRGKTPGEIAKFATEAVKPQWRDKIVELFYASILSAPTTHAINIVGNTGALALSVPEFALASALGSLRLGSSNRVYAAELGGYMAGMTQGVRNGLKAAARTVRTGEVADPLTKLDVRHPEAIGGLKGYAIRTPLRFLAGEDEFFKAIARQGAIGRLAVKQAKREGLKGEALAQRASGIAANPPEAILSQAVDFARHMTFTDRPGFFGSLVLQATNKYPLLGKLNIPFVQTLGNLMVFSAQRSPLAIVMPSVLKSLKAGGEERDLAIARIAVGSTIGMLGYQAAKQGLITGGAPLNTQTRELLEEEGWQPYSVKVGDRYISYRQFDPVSLPISIAADLANYDEFMTERERQRSASILAQMISRNLQDSFWLGSVSEIFDMVDKPWDKVPGRVGSIAGALAVPNFISQPTASYDPVIRDQRADPEAHWGIQPLLSIMNRVQARIPGLRDNLPARKNIWGEDKRNDGRWGFDVISPLKQRIIQNDPLNQAMIENGLRVGEAGSSINAVPVPKDLRGKFNKLANDYIRQDMKELMAMPEWKSATTEDRKAWWDDVKRDAREDAKWDLGLQDWGTEDYQPAPDDVAAPVYSDVPPGWEVEAP